MALYLKNATYVDAQTFKIKETDIKVEEGPAGGIQFVEAIPAGEEVLDCTGKVVTRSFGCGHHHVYSALARGMNPPKKIPENFTEILQYVWWTLDKNLDLEMIEASALATAMECAKHGVTYCIDHHASPFAVKGSLETLAKAFDRVGVSHLLCYELSDRDGEQSVKEALEEHDSYLASGRDGLVGLHASFTVGDELLKSAVDMARKHNSGIHVHVAEGTVDQEHCEKTYGKRVIERYKDAGVLDFSKTLLIHNLHLNDKERQLIKESPVWLVQNAESNLNNNVGQFDSKGLTDKLMLGTDGMHSDMLRSAKAAFYTNQPVEGVSVPEMYRRFRNVHNYVAENGFSGDSANNLVVLDYYRPTVMHENNFLGHWLFGIGAEHVESVISGGKVILKDRKLTQVDEAEIQSFAQEMGLKLWDKMSK